MLGAALGTGSAFLTGSGFGYTLPVCLPGGRVMAAPGRPKKLMRIDVDDISGPTNSSTAYYIVFPLA